ncbi:MAG TPA: glycosyltransferase family 4 protein [Candidatus Saccharimonadales bacterium]|nr:glycosyltransferase family 4 protein [Candidatus Saccharimonadales bacterium]
MKIGLVCPYNIALGGGVQELIRAMQVRLSARGHEVKIIAAQPRELNGVDTTNILFLGRGIDIQWPNHTVAPLSSGLSMEAIEQTMEAEKFDILHFHEPWVPALSRQILSCSQSVNIATFHAKVPETIMNRTLARVITPYMRSVLRDLHELTAVSKPASEYVSSLTDRPITFIPNGIDLQRFAFTKRPKAGSPKTILYIGRLEPRKGVKYLLRAYRLLALSHEDVRLVIVGDGFDRPKLEAYVQDLHIPNVSFLGYVQEDEKVRLLSEADVFCSPALFGESFGIVLLEAMASGTVVAAGDNSGYASVMKELGALSLVNPKDAPEFARRLRLLLCEPKLRALWQDWAEAYVQQFDYEKVVDQYEALYKTALKKHAALAATTA